MPVNVISANDHLWDCLIPKYVVNTRHLVCILQKKSGRHSPGPPTKTAELRSIIYCNAPPQSIFRVRAWYILIDVFFLSLGLHKGHITVY